MRRQCNAKATRRPRKGHAKAGVTWHAKADVNVCKCLRCHICIKISIYGYIRGKTRAPRLGLSPTDCRLHLITTDTGAQHRAQDESRDPLGQKWLYSRACCTTVLPRHGVQTVHQGHSVGTRDDETPKGVEKTTANAGPNIEQE